MSQGANALKAYWESQNRRLQQLERFVAQGGSISKELLQAVDHFEQNNLTAYEQMVQGQKLLLSQLFAVPQKTENTNPWANPIIDAIDPEDPHAMKRLEVQLVPCADVPRGEHTLPKSGILLMLGDEDAYAVALKRYLLDHGLQIKHIRDFLDEDQAETQVASAAREGEIAGLVVLGNKYEGYYHYILTIAAMIKRVVMHIRTQKTDRKFLFLFHTFLDGKLGTTGKSDHYHYGTLGGMAKCIDIELSGSVYAKAIDFEPSMEPDTMIAHLDDELRVRERLTEVGRTADGARHRMSTVLTRSVVTENRCPLTQEDVLLVTGGARGVTSECILELAKRVKCTFVLMGRAQILDENKDDEETAKITDPKNMKLLIAQRYKAQGYKGSLSVIEKKAKAILAQRDMLATFEKLRSTGNRVFYYACDVNDRESMTQTMATIQKEVGKITAVVHGAGIVADCKIWNKSMESFCRVFDTKYQGLNNIIDNVDKHTLKLLVMFSSVSGFFGNDGQIDYVAGNAYMDKFAYYMRNHYPNCRALAINWGAWNGGMVNLDALYVDALKERGYILIPLPVGANYFANEFLMGLPSAQIMINNTGNPAVKEGGVWG